MPQDLPRGFLPLESRKRLAYLSLSVVLFFSLLLVQFYKIQIVEKEKWSRKADAQHQLVLIDPCQRGSFYSNTEIKSGHLENPVALVFDVPRFHLYADTTALLEGQKKDVTGFLTGTFLEKKEHLFTQLAAKSRGRKLLTWLTQEEKKKIESWWFPYAKQHKLARNVLF
ncbi:MAG: penicillin-binding protein 2, partial [Chlamydiae bacterium]|nr:penicillin-binding protein 2 [Chlamydiota bacterium]